MTSVETLSLAPCPCFIGDTQDCCGGLSITHCRRPCPDSCACGGTGARVPGLWKPCPNTWCGRADKRTKTPPPPLAGCMECQGRGTVLIPEAEQLEPLMIELLSCVGEVVIGKTGKGDRFEQDHTGYYLVIDGVPTAVVAWKKLPEMAAAAINQALA